RERIETGGVVILLAGIHARTAGVARADVQKYACAKSVDPSAAIVPALRSTRRRRNFSNGGGRHYTMLGVAEKQVIAIAETVVHSNLKAVRVISSGAALYKIVRHIAGRAVVGCRGVSLEELLHRPEDQSLRNLIAHRARR